MQHLASSPEKIVRFAYVDEAGLGSVEREPLTVVAGVLLHVDNQHEALSRYLLDMADDLVGPVRPLNFHFHAKDLWHGAGFFNREKWELSKRLEILHHLSEIPTKFDLPIFHCVVERRKHPPKADGGDAARKAATRKHHLLAYMGCLQMIDRYMAERLSDEKAFVVVEDHRDHRMILRGAAQLMGNPRARNAIERDPTVHWRPYTHLVEEPLFQGKSGSNALQVADVCAFILNRHFCNGNHIGPFVELIEPCLAIGLTKDTFKTVSSEEEAS